MLNRIKKWIQKQFEPEYCTKHPDTALPGSRYFNICPKCWSEACKAQAKEEREARIEETKEAIVRAHNELNKKG